MLTRLCTVATLMLLAAPAWGQGLVVTSSENTPTIAQVQAAKASADASVKTVNGAAPVNGAVTLTIPATPDLTSYVKTSALPAPYTDAQARAAASTITSFSSANIAMPNGANLAHTIYQARPAGGFLTIAGTGEQSVFATTGDGNLTVQPIAMFVGARFHLHDRGRATTGTLNVSGITARLKLGGVTLVSGSTIGLPVSLTNIPFWSDIDCKVLSTGVTGSILCYGALHYAAGTSSSALVLTDMSSAIPVTINTTIAQTWEATVQLSSLIGAPSVVIYDAFIIQEN